MLEIGLDGCCAHRTAAVMAESRRRLFETRWSVFAWLSYEPACSVPLYPSCSPLLPSIFISAPDSALHAWTAAPPSLVPMYT